MIDYGTIYDSVEQNFDTLTVKDLYLVRLFGKIRLQNFQKNKVYLWVSCVCNKSFEQFGKIISDFQAFILEVAAVKLINTVSIF